MKDLVFSRYPFAVYRFCWPRQVELNDMLSFSLALAYVKITILQSIMYNV